MISFRSLLRLLYGFRGESSRLAFGAGVTAAFSLSLITAWVVLEMLNWLPSDGTYRAGALASAALVTAAVVAIIGPLGWSLLALTIKRHRAWAVAGWTGPAALITFGGATKLLTDAGREHSWAGLLVSSLYVGWVLALFLWPSVVTAQRRAVEAF